MEVALKAESVCRSYGRGAARTSVLRDFSLELAPGAFEVLMGPSGSGKSTFLHLAAGLLSADSGKIFVGGSEVTAMGDSAASRFRRRHVGVVFQDFNLLDELTVAENIALPVRLDRGTPDASRLSALVARLGLSGLEGRRPDELSGGERQRVALARALVTDPELVLADEPTGNLDSHSSLAVMEELKRIHSEGNTIIMVTHNPSLTSYATRVINMLDGAIDTDVKTVKDSDLPVPIEKKTPKRIFKSRNKSKPKKKKGKK